MEDKEKSYPICINGVLGDEKTLEKELEEIAANFVKEFDSFLGLNLGAKPCQN